MAQPTFSVLQFRNWLTKNNSVFVFFGNAYAIKYFENIGDARGLVVAYQNNELTQELAAQLVFGANDANGRLPVTVDS